jgi:hypothetical protein
MNVKLLSVEEFLNKAEAGMIPVQANSFQT